MKKSMLNFDFSDFSEVFGNEENKRLLEDKDIYVLLSGDEESLPKYAPNYRLGNNEPRIEQHIEIAKHISMDDGSYTEISELELSSFNILEEVLEQINFNASYSQYRKLRQIVKSRTVKFYDVTYLILYFLVNDLLEALQES